MKPNIDIIVPIFNEERNLHSLINELLAQTQSLTKYKWRFIFVNDGSSDDSIHILKGFAKQNRFIQIIDLSRNYGKELALTAGLDHSTGNAAIFLDADLQHPPYLIPQLCEKWERGILIVSAIRASTKKQPIIRKIGSAFFYWILNRLSSVQFTPRSTDYKLLDKKIVNILKNFTERNRMFRGLIDWIGFETDYIIFNAPERYDKKARYTFKKLLNLAINSIASFSLMPLKLAGYIGLFITCVSSILLLVMLIVRFILKSPIFTSLSFVVVSNTILIGIVLTCMGFIALYIGQIHSEVVNRPLYIIKEKMNFRR